MEIRPADDPARQSFGSDRVAFNTSQGGSSRSSPTAPLTRGAPHLEPNQISDSEAAHRQDRSGADQSGALYLAGFVALPLLWAVNVYLYWPDFRHGRDREIAKLTRRSALGVGVWLTILVPWLLAFSIGQDVIFGHKLFERMNIVGINMAEWGLEF